MAKRWMKSVLAVTALSAGLVAFADEPAAPTPEQMQAMMEAWMKNMTPGQQHADMQKFVGEWNYVMEDFTSGTPMTMTGTSTHSLILGGRVLEMRTAGDYMGVAWEGLGLTGYDNTTGQYWSIWSDSMGTGVAVSYGTETEPGVVTYKGSMTNPMTGKPIAFTTITKMPDADTGIFEMHMGNMMTGEGPEVLAMRITYTRKK